MVKVKDVIEVVVAFIIAFLVYQALVLATGTPVPVVSVASGSMIPKFYPGDLVISTAPKNLNVGDIIIYRARPGCFERIENEDIIHRIIRFENEKIITKGDNNPREDPCPVERAQVKAKVVFAVPLLGWPRLILNYLIEMLF
ncbi:MAG: signal peptidase I [Candidatus Aenigmatarchaeota archaeon]